MIVLIQGSFQEGKDIHSDPFQGGKIWENLRKLLVSTVSTVQVNKFQMAYCNLLKSNMDGLRRQKKQKAKKATLWLTSLDLPWETKI